MPTNTMILIRVGWFALVEVLLIEVLLVEVLLDGQ